MRKCENCEFTERIDKNIMCMKNTCPITVIDNGKHNHNYGWCNKEENNDNKYGPMAYQEERR